MNLSRFSLATVALILAQPAAADLSADDVWTDWQAYNNALGINISGQEVQTPEGLSVEDVKIDANYADGLAVLEVSLGTLLFNETSDGSVDIVFPPEMTAEMRVEIGPQTTDTTEATYRQDGLVMRVEGTPENLTYTFAAQELSGESASSTTAGGQAVSTQNVSFVMSDVTGESFSSLSNVRKVVSSLSAARSVYSTSFQDARSNASATGTGTFADLSMTSEASLPLLVLQEFDLSKQIEAGLSAQGQIEVGANSAEISTQGSDPLDAITTAEAASLDFELGQDGLRYDIAQQTGAIQIAGDFLPLPLSASVEEAEFVIGLPIIKSDDAKDFALGLTLDGLTMSESLWAMFDPTSGLPRDPARIVLDLSGKARLLFDLLNPPTDNSATPEDFTPAEIETLDINRLELSGIGASLKGEGAFTFDKPIEGTNMPRPTGTVDLELQGANGLLDKLVGLGLLPEDQAMGARLMMGLLGVPGDDPDTLRSKIEVNDKFQIFANGQRIQ